MKRLYHILALLALVNLFAVAGLIGYLFASGRLTAERLDQIAMVLRGEFPEPPPAAAAASSPQAPPEASEEEIARLRARQEYYALLADRHKRELDDRQSLARTTQIETMRLLEEIEKKEKAFKAERKQTLEKEQQAGFEKELEIFSQMDAGMAKDLLKTRKDADVVRLLSEMDVNRAKKIIDACKKKEEDKVWIGRIVEQIPQLGQQ